MRTPPARWAVGEGGRTLGSVRKPASSTGVAASTMTSRPARPGVSATYLPGEGLAMIVQGQAELFQLSYPSHEELHEAVLDRYLPKQGPAFETWRDQEDPVEARIVADKMFTFSLAGDIARVRREPRWRIPVGRRRLD